MAHPTEVHPLHADIVERIKERMPDRESLARLAEFFKVCGDATRTKILFALFYTDMCVYDIAALLRMQQSAVSHQLRVLKQAGLVKFRREGKVIYYSLDDEHVQQIFQLSLIHQQEK
jgi:ArsR family transcriptional regulator